MRSSCLSMWLWSIPSQVMPCFSTIFRDRELRGVTGAYPCVNLSQLSLSKTPAQEPARRFRHETFVPVGRVYAVFQFRDFMVNVDIQIDDPDDSFAEDHHPRGIGFPGNEDTTSDRLISILEGVWLRNRKKLGSLGANRVAGNVVCVRQR